MMAEDKLVMCGVASGSSSSGAMVVCNGTVLCLAMCINNASCAELKDAVSGMPTQLSKTYLDCANACLQP